MIAIEQNVHHALGGQIQLGLAQRLEKLHTIAHQVLVAAHATAMAQATKGGNQAFGLAAFQKAENEQMQFPFAIRFDARTNTLAKRRIGNANTKSAPTIFQSTEDRGQGARPLKGIEHAVEIGLVHLKKVQEEVQVHGLVHEGKQFQEGSPLVVDRFGQGLGILMGIIRNVGAHGV